MSTTLISGTGFYTRNYTQGTLMVPITGQSPPVTNWNDPAVTVTSYSNIQVKVRDNWGHESNVYVTIPEKVAYGYNWAMQ